MQYVPVSTPNRKLYIIDDDDDEENDEAQSDLVRLILNLPYLKEEDAMRFSFDKKAASGLINKSLGNFLKGSSRGLKGAYSVNE